MADSLLTPTIIAQESLMQLENNTVMGANVHRQYKEEFVKIGESVTIRRPVKFTVTDGAPLSNQDVSEGQTSLSIDQRKHVAWDFSTQDLTMTIENYAERYIKPACIALANKVDLGLTTLYSDLFMSAGTPGTTPATFSALGDLAAVLDEGAVPDDGMRKLVLNSRARWSMADALKGIYDASIPQEYVRHGLLGKLANFQIYGDQNITMHTTGARINDTILVQGASQEQTYSTTVDTGSLIVDGFAADTASSVKAGDVFTIADVYAVNPVSKVSTGQLQRFTVTANATPSSGAATLTIRPRIITSGAYQTVDSSPANNAAITFMGTQATAYPQNLGFHKNALALVMCPLDLPDSAVWKARADHNGMSIRAYKFLDGINDVEKIRLDVFYGHKAIYPDLGARLWG